MVVLMDPCDDPDDILRVNRSREKQYVFDLALGPAASQVDIIIGFLSTPWKMCLPIETLYILLKTGGESSANDKVS